MIEFTFLKFQGPPGMIFPLTAGWTVTLNIYSQVGLVTLVGLVSKNGILIVEFANVQQERGLSKIEVVKAAAATKLRPIVMTTIATVAGLSPLTLVTGPGAVARNAERFPADFAFKLTSEEFETLRSQFATSKAERRGGRRTLPTVFTEYGALMAASVLNSPKAVEMSIQVVRTFVRLRHLLASHHQLTAKLDELEHRTATHDTHSVALFDAVRSLMATPEKPKRQIGFQTKGKDRSPTKARERGGE